MFLLSLQGVSIILIISFPLYILFKFYLFIEDLYSKVSSLEKDLQQKMDLTQEDKEKVKKIISFSEKSILEHMKEFEQNVPDILYKQGYSKTGSNYDYHYTRELVEEEHRVRMKHAFVTAFLPNTKYQVEKILPLFFNHTVRPNHRDFTKGDWFTGSNGFNQILNEESNVMKDFAKEVKRIMG